jgi:GNAT superfamily N-acetyltransferase
MNIVTLNDEHLDLCTSISEVYAKTLLDLDKRRLPAYVQEGISNEQRDVYEQILKGNKHGYQVDAAFVCNIVYGFSEWRVYKEVQGKKEWNNAELKWLIANVRGKGAGKSLLNFHLDQCLERELDLSHLSVHENNFPAVSLYKSAGYIKCGNVKDKPGMIKMGLPFTTKGQEAINWAKQIS